MTIQEPRSRPDQVTVYMPTRNRPALALRAARSVLAQDHPHVQLIVVDDGSDPALFDRLQLGMARLGPRVILLRNRSRAGAPQSRNVAILRARSRFVTGIDDDDQFLPQRISRFLAAWEEGTSFLYADDILCDRGRQRVWRKGDAGLRQMLGRNAVGNQIFSLRSHFLTLGGFDPALPSAQDHDLWVRMTRLYGPGRRVAQPTQRLHVDTGRARISSSKEVWRGYWQLYLRHRPELDRAQRKRRLFAIAVARSRARGGRIGWRQRLALTCRGNLRAVLRYSLSGLMRARRPG